MKKFQGNKFALVLILTTLIAGVAVAEGEAEGDVTEVILADTSWDSVLVHNRIVEFILEEGYGGYEVDFVPGDTIPLFTGVVSGDIDATMESWHTNYPEAYEEAMAEGSIVDLGSNYPDGPQGWWVPRYMLEGDPARGIEATAPDLKSVADLPKYADLFPDPEKPGMGRIIFPPPGWTATIVSEGIMEEFGLEDTYTGFLPGSGASLAASMKGAFDQGEPWVGYYWEPTAIMYQLDMVRLEGSEFPKAAVNILMNAESYEEMPEVAEFFSNYDTTVAVNNEFLNYLSTEADDHRDAAIWFLENHEEMWTEWVPAEVADNVRAALQ